MEEAYVSGFVVAWLCLNVSENGAGQSVLMEVLSWLGCGWWVYVMSRALLRPYENGCMSTLTAPWNGGDHNVGDGIGYYGDGCLNRLVFMR